MFELNYQWVAGYLFLPWPAELFVPLHQEFRGLESRQAVEVGHLIVGAIQRALGRGAVVPNDIVDERVVEDVELLQAVEQASDMVVGEDEEGRRGIESSECV